MNAQHIIYLMALRNEARQKAEAYAQRNEDKEVMLQRQYEMALSAAIKALQNSPLNKAELDIPLTNDHTGANIRS